jgi:GT2 family glycosyltransferase
MQFEGLGIVVIGRNEGERLLACLRSLPAGVPVVYVDSGSTDGSPQKAADSGAFVVELTSDKPFSAARGRNAGFERLRQEAQDLRYVQFIDGDCVLDPGWLPKAVAALEEEPRLAVVAGLRQERYPERSWYNELCAIEWNTPVGEAHAVGGDALYKAEALTGVGGFDPMMMAGEEPELCLRLRGQGYRVERLDADMTLHDAAIHSFDAWWKRAVRSGYAYTLGALKHARTGYNSREVARSLLWGALLPVLALGFLIAGFPILTIAIVSLYALKWWRIRRRSLGLTVRPGRYALFIMLTNCAEVLGIVRALVETARGERKILEYKTV